MKQLSGLDAAFLYMETPSQFGHISSLSVYQRPDSPGWEPFAAWRDQVERRLHLLEPLRRRLREVPFRFELPYWIQDPDFDLDFHVRHTAIPPPGSDEQMANLVSRIIARPLDRGRPLWVSYVIEGLGDDRFAILTKVHHATVDGASGAELLTMMLDASADPADPPQATPWEADRMPSDLAVSLRAATDLARKPVRGVLLTARVVRGIGQATRNPALVAGADAVRRGIRGPLRPLLNRGGPRPEEGTAVPPLPSLRPPPTPFNAPITPHRRFAYRSVSLDAVKAIKRAMGATVNDVVMSVCAGGLRTWLIDHDALPDKPLVAAVPVSTRTGGEPDRWTNRVSMLIAELATDEADPVLRVGRLHEAMVASKGLFDAIPAEALTDFAQFPAPAVFARATRLAGRLHLGQRLPANLVISNVPGPRQPLYAAGARLLHYYPVSTIVDGQGLNITVQSYLDVLDFGLVACRELVPDLDALMDNIVDEVEGLAKAVDVDVAVTVSG